MAGLLYSKEVRINDQISLCIPSVGDVIDHEEAYYEGVSTILATPYDMMVELDDAKIDFTKITQFELFGLMLRHLKEIDTSLIFGELRLDEYRTAVSEETNELMLINERNGSVIDRPTHSIICKELARILWIEKKLKTPANEEAKRYLLQRARAKRRRKKKREEGDSQIEGLIIGLVNTEQFPYDYETVRNISIYQFYASLHQISHKIRFDNTMIGYYAGTVKIEDLSTDDRSWLMRAAAT